MRKRNTPLMTSAEREQVYHSIFRLNHSFHGIVSRLDELAGLLGRKNLNAMLGLTQEVQTEINTLLLENLSSNESYDWTHFGKIRIAMEKRLQGKRE